MSSPVAHLRKPTRAVQSRKPEPPSAIDGGALHRPNSGANTQLQLQVPPEIRRAVKAHAAENDMTMSELFLRMWSAYKQANP